MGVLTDYFRAADDQDAARVRSIAGPTAGGGSVFDAVEAKGIDHTVVLGKLVALVRDAEWTPGLCSGRLVEAASGSPEEGDLEDGPEDDLEDGPEDDLEDGPWVFALGDDVRDTLADLDPEALPDLAAQWSQIEELSGSRPAELLVVLEELRALSARARDAGDHLYEWCCL